VVFSAAVASFDATDVTLTSTAGATYAVVTGSSATYNVAVYGMSASGTVTATIAADRAVSTSGNHPSQASTSTDNTVSFRLASKFLVTSSSYSPVPGSAVTISAQLADSLNNVVPATGAVVTWTSTNGGFFSAATSTTNASGIATATFTVSTTSSVVHTVTATSGSFTGTSASITTSLPTTTITLTRSTGMVAYGQLAGFSVQFGIGGASRAFVLEAASVGVPWTTVATATTNAGGLAAFSYKPTRTAYYRARFAGSTDLAATISGVALVGVRQTATLSPHHAGTTVIARGTSVTFSSTIRPARLDLAPSSAVFLFYKKVGGAWTLAYTRNVAADTSGRATTTFRFSSASWYVRAYAARSPYNAVSRFTQREYYLVP
jgi:hypothetical protein